MAHGAPDHVRMQDINIADYVDKSFLLDVYVIDDTETWSPVDITGVGCLGLTYFLTNYSELDLVIWMDGVKIFEENPNSLRYYHSTVGVALSDRCACSCYDITLPLYAMWVDFHYLRSFRKTLKIQFVNPVAFAKNINNIRCYWKERE